MKVKRPLRRTQESQAAAAPAAQCLAANPDTCSACRAQPCHTLRALSVYPVCSPASPTCAPNWLLSTASQATSGLRQAAALRSTCQWHTCSACIRAHTCTSTHTDRGALTHMRKHTHRPRCPHTHALAHTDQGALTHMHKHTQTKAPSHTCTSTHRPRCPRTRATHALSCTRGGTVPPACHLPGP